MPVTEETPSFRNIFMKDIRVIGSKKAAFLMGLPEMKLKNVHLENAIFEVEEGITIIDGLNISLKNVKIIQKESPALIIYNSEDIDVNEFEFDKNPVGPSVQILGKSKKIKFSKSNISDADLEVAKNNKIQVIN